MRLSRLVAGFLWVGCVAGGDVGQFRYFGVEAVDPLPGGAHLLDPKDLAATGPIVECHSPLLGLLLARTEAEPARADPVEAVRDMLDAYSRRAEAYVQWMAEDYVFESDDPDFRAAFPNGMTRDDERVHATHLFRGGGKGPDGQALPHAVSVDLIHGPLVAVPLGDQRAQIRVVMDLCHVAIRLSDGSVFGVGGTHNELDVVLTEAGWRVRRWRETRPSAAAGDTEPADTSSAATVMVSAAIDSVGSAGESLESAPPARLVLMPLAGPARNVMRFKIALPRRGGTLELFDVLGRRLARCDLSELPAGNHTVTIADAVHRSGVYVARLTQASAVTTAKVVWAR